MDISKSIVDARDKVKSAKKAGKRIGFVPTMGYLHKGHLSLVEISKSLADYQVMSIFVNKMQFNDVADFNSYPRELQRDLELAKDAGVDLVFMPEDEDMYRDPLTYVDMHTLTYHLCGAHREGHFRGVFTVVAKLFNIIDPDISVFGQKDIQQAIGIKKMIDDLNFPTEIIIAPIVRENDGLAMSSRNKHLKEEERKASLAIYNSLKRTEELINSGETANSRLIEEIRRTIAVGNPQKIDYISIVSYHDLQPIESITDKSVIAIAAFFGTTRLIDNMIVERKDKGYKCTY